MSPTRVDAPAGAYPGPARIRLLTFCLSAALVSASCASHDPVSSGTTHPTPTRRLAIVLFGFFNNEDPHSFNPSPIGYVSVNRETVYRALARKANAVAWSSPIRVLSWAELNVLYDREFPDADRALATSRLQKALEVLHGVAMNEVSVLEKEKKLEAPLPPSAGLNADDRILFVVGLETCTPGGDPHLLRSVLGCFWFSGDGPYLAGAIQQYDFSHFGTKDMVALVAKCFPKRSSM